MNTVVRLILCLSLFSLGLAPLRAMSEPMKIGMVIMHGKGGSPSKHVSELASALEEKGYLVANLEMPWSQNREYDVEISAAESQVQEALDSMRARGAQKLFVAGHSQGGVFALHFAGGHQVDGIICIAPGGSVDSKVFREKLGTTVERARQLVAEGKGSEKTRLEDFEGKKGLFPVITTPATYLTWFDPEGAMNSQRAARVAKPDTPILWIVAERDYPGLKKANIPLFKTLPRTPHTRLLEPASDHHGAPTASIDEIARWTAEVAAASR